MTEFRMAAWASWAWIQGCYLRNGNWLSQRWLLIALAIMTLGSIVGSLEKRA